MRLSVITPTYRREELLAQCIEKVAAQECAADIEHLVVNDAGQPLTPAPWMDLPHVRVLNTNKTERSVARNVGAALSTGDWLYFLDDDDFPLPGAFVSLLETVGRNPDAVHVYGSYEILDETTNVVSPLHLRLPPDLFPLLFAGETLPLQASWLRRDAFFQAGGFDPLFVPTEDVDLLQRLVRLGPSAGTAELVARVRVNHPATTTTSKQAAGEGFRTMPEHWVQPLVTFPKLRAATRSNPYWAGRCARQYLLTGYRCARTRRFAACLSRTLLAARLSASHALAPALYRGLRRADPPPLP
jgi:glycosyltransferase involved in cell wall biosynthesis